MCLCLCRRTGAARVLPKFQTWNSVSDGRCIALFRVGGRFFQVSSTMERNIMPRDSFCGKAVDGRGDRQQAEGKKQQPNYCWTLLLACSLCPLQQWYNRKNKAVHFIKIEIWQGGKWLSHTLPAVLHSEGFWWQWLSNVAQKLIKSIQSEFLCSSPNCLVSLSQGLMAKLFITIFTA